MRDITQQPVRRLGEHVVFAMIFGIITNDAIGALSHSTNHMLFPLTLLGLSREAASVGWCALAVRTAVVTTAYATYNEWTHVTLTQVVHEQNWPRDQSLTDLNERMVLAKLADETQMDGS